jgi:hypothetical protein
MKVARKWTTSVATEFHWSLKSFVRAASSLLSHWQRFLLSELVGPQSLARVNGCFWNCAPLSIVLAPGDCIYIVSTGHYIYMYPTHMFLTSFLVFLFTNLNSVFVYFFPPFLFFGALFLSSYSFFLLCVFLLSISYLFICLFIYFTFLRSIDFSLFPLFISFFVYYIPSFLSLFLA